MSYYTEFKKILENSIKESASNLSLLSQVNSQIISTPVGKSSGNSFTSMYSDDNVVTTLNSYISTLRALKYNVNKNVSDDIIDLTINQLQGILPVPTTINQIKYALQEFYKTHQASMGTYTIAQDYLKEKFGAALDKTISDSIIKSFITK